ncbi:hypothetical protein [Sodalis sp. RH16]|uniref:hypothetical protein n=1 Tax=Sodalis sp. RH16 TaxID=3394331 RepID=UPI0039B47F19
MVNVESNVDVEVKAGGRPALADPVADKIGCDLAARAEDKVDFAVPDKGDFAASVFVLLPLLTSALIPGGSC